MDVNQCAQTEPFLLFVVSYCWAATPLLCMRERILRNLLRYVAFVLVAHARACASSRLYVYLCRRHARVYQNYMYQAHVRVAEAVYIYAKKVEFQSCALRSCLKNASFPENASWSTNDIRPGGYKCCCFEAVASRLVLKPFTFSALKNTRKRLERLMMSKNSSDTTVISRNCYQVFIYVPRN